MKQGVVGKHEALLSQTIHAQNNTRANTCKTGRDTQTPAHVGDDFLCAKLNLHEAHLLKALMSGLRRSCRDPHRVRQLGSLQPLQYVGTPGHRVRSMRRSWRGRCRVAAGPAHPVVWQPTRGGFTNYIHGLLFRE